MPRTRKTQNGKPALPMASVSGQQYGANVQQQQLQTSLPTPVDPTKQAIAKAAATASSPAVQSPARRPDPMALAQQLRAKMGLLAPGTARPTEPVTAGLSTGPGPGPEVLGMNQRSPLGETMRMVARQSGDNYLATLADRLAL